MFSTGASEKVDKTTSVVINVSFALWELVRTYTKQAGQTRQWSDDVCRRSTSFQSAKEGPRWLHTPVCNSKSRKMSSCSFCWAQGASSCKRRTYKPCPCSHCFLGASVSGVPSNRGQKTFKNAPGNAGFWKPIELGGPEICVCVCS